MATTDEPTQPLRTVGGKTFRTREKPLTRPLTVVLDGNGAWSDLAFRHERGELLWVRNDARMEVSGFGDDPFDPETPVVSIRLDLPDGRTAIGSVTMESFCAAADALRAKYLKQK